MLYWSDWSSTSPGIYRSSVLSPARETLVSGGLGWPNALTIDFSGTDNYVPEKTVEMCLLQRTFMLYEIKL